jgi:polysaccharide pyruvyl transferase WcaK-like protein
VDRQAGKHVVLLGQFGIGNTGNDATGRIVLDFLKKQLPETKFTIVSTFPETASKVFKEPMVDLLARVEARFPWRGPLRRIPNELLRRKQTKEVLATADCLLIPGTGIFDDFWSQIGAFAYPLWRWCQTARDLGVPVAFVSVGAGPIEGRLSCALFRATAATANHRSYRDAVSRDFVRDIFGLDVSNDAVTPDLVFGMEPGPSQICGSTGVIGIGVMDYHTWRGARGGKDDVYDDYMGKLAIMCMDLLKQSRALRILIGDPTDATAAADLMGRLRAAMPEQAGSVSVANTTTLQDIVREIGNTDAVIATRYHTVVGALLSGRPTLSIEYAPKNSAIMKEFGLGEYCQHIASLDLDRLRRQFADVTADIPKTSERLCTVRDRMRETVRRHLEGVAAGIAASGRPAPASGVRPGIRTSPAAS